MKVFLFATLVCCALAVNDIDPGTPITQCDDQRIECPEISNIQVEEGYELRTYPLSKWASHMLAGPALEDFEELSGQNFQKLFEYIDGGNDQNMKIPMTGPVITEISPGPGPNCENNFTTSFYQPKDLWENQPNPTVDGVFLEEFPETKIYAIAFDGFANVNNYIEYLQRLIDNIGDTSLYYTDFYFFVGYNSPFDPFNRRNEVWLVGIYPEAAVGIRKAQAPVPVNNNVFKITTTRGAKNTHEQKVARKVKNDKKAASKATKFPKIPKRKPAHLKRVKSVAKPAPKK